MSFPLLPTIGFGSVASTDTSALLATIDESLLEFGLAPSLEGPAPVEGKPFSEFAELLFETPAASGGKIDFETKPRGELAANQLVDASPPAPLPELLDSTTSEKGAGRVDSTNNTAPNLIYDLPVDTRPDFADSAIKGNQKTGNVTQLTGEAVVVDPNYQPEKVHEVAGYEDTPAVVDLPVSAREGQLVLNREHSESTVESATPESVSLETPSPRLTESPRVIPHDGIQPTNETSVNPIAQPTGRVTPPANPPIISESASPESPAPVPAPIVENRYSPEQPTSEQSPQTTASAHGGSSDLESPTSASVELQIESTSLPHASESFEVTTQPVGALTRESIAPRSLPTDEVVTPQLQSETTDRATEPNDPAIRPTVAENISATTVQPVRPTIERRSTSPSERPAATAAELVLQSRTPTAASGRIQTPAVESESAPLPRVADINPPATRVAAAETQVAQTPSPLAAFAQSDLTPTPPTNAIEAPQPDTKVATSGPLPLNRSQQVENPPVATGPDSSPPSPIQTDSPQTQAAVGTVVEKASVGDLNTEISSTPIEEQSPSTSPAQTAQPLPATESIAAIEAPSVEPAAALEASTPVEEQVAAKIVAETEWRPEAGQGEFRMRLTPRELGEIRVKFTRSGETMRAEISAVKPDTANLLNSRVEQLVTSLQRAGVESVEVQIEMESFSNEHSSGFNQHESTATPHEQRGRMYNPYAQSTPHREESSPSAPTNAGANHQLDLTI